MRIKVTSTFDVPTKLISSSFNIDPFIRFYYADERKADGQPAYMDIDGAAHAEQYVTLAEETSQGPWHQTFVKGVGYKQFPAA